MQKQCSNRLFASPLGLPCHLKKETPLAKISNADCPLHKKEDEDEEVHEVYLLLRQGYFIPSASGDLAVLVKNFP